MSKTEREDPLGFFNILSVAKLQKKLKGNPLASSGFVCYAGNLFGSVPWANRYNLASFQNFVELLVELFWSLQVVLKFFLKKH